LGFRRCPGQYAGGGVEHHSGRSRSQTERQSVGRHVGIGRQVGHHQRGQFVEGLIRRHGQDGGAVYFADDDREALGIRQLRRPIVADLHANQVRARTVRFGRRPGQEAGVWVEHHTWRRRDQTEGERIGWHIRVYGPVRDRQRGQFVDCLVGRRHQNGRTIYVVYGDGETSDITQRRRTVVGNLDGDEVGAGALVC